MNRASHLWPTTQKLKLSGIQYSLATILPSYNNIYYYHITEYSTKYTFVRTVSPSKWHARIIRLNFRRWLTNRVYVTVTSTYSQALGVYKPLEPEVLDIRRGFVSLVSASWHQTRICFLFSASIELPWIMASAMLMSIPSNSSSRSSRDSLSRTAATHASLPYEQKLSEACSRRWWFGTS